MASHTISNQPWPSGTVVSVYAGEAQPAGQDTVPAGVAVTTGTVAGSSVTFSGLDEGRRYLAYAAGVSKRFLIQPGSVDTLRPITGAEAQSMRSRIEALEEQLAGERYDVVLEGGIDSTGLTAVSALLEAQLANAKALGRAAYIRAGTYKMTDGYTIAIPDGLAVVTDGLQTVFDCSAWTVSTYVFQCAGSGGTPMLLTANATAGDLTLTVASTATLAAGQYVKVYSTNTISFTGMMPGEFVRIESVDSGTQVTLADPLVDSYTTANVASLSVWTLKTCEWTGGKLLGPTDATVLLTGFSFYATQGVGVEKVRFERIHNAGAAFSESIGWRAAGCHTKDAKGAGLAYGITASYTCQDFTITNCTSLRGRHLVAVGGGSSYSGFSRRGAISNCTASEVVDAGFDCHPGGEEINYDNCHVKGSVQDGIVFQGSSGSITNCSVRGVGAPATSARFGIFIQPLTTYALNVGVSNNRVEGKVTSTERGRGICLSITSGYEVYDAVVITGNRVTDTYNGIECTTPTATKISGLVISNNIVRRGALSAACITVTKAELASITGNVLTMASSSRSGIKLDTVIDSTISANVIKINGSTNCFGIQGVAVADCEIMGNRCIAGSSSGTGISLDAASSNCTIMGNNCRTCPTPINVNGVTSHILSTADAAGAYNRT